MIEDGNYDLISLHKNKFSWNMSTKFNFSFQ